MACCLYNNEKMKVECFKEKCKRGMFFFFLYFQLDCGAKVTAKGIDQMTPLSVAAQKGSADIMALFFKKCT